MSERRDYVQLAYAVSRRRGETLYRAVALAGNHGHKGYHTRRLGLGDTREEAEREALAYVAQAFRLDHLTPPTEVVNHGRLHGAIVDGAIFWRDQ